MDGKADRIRSMCRHLCETAQREMIAPALAGILSPIIIGVVPVSTAWPGCVGPLSPGSFCCDDGQPGGSWDNEKISKAANTVEGSDCHSGSRATPW